MGVHDWARQEIEQSMVRAREQGFDPVMSLRALLSAIVASNGSVREAGDLAAELQYLAENLDDRDYSFMRP